MIRSLQGNGFRGAKIRERTAKRHESYDSCLCDRAIPFQGTELTGTALSFCFSFPVCLHPPGRGMKRERDEKSCLTDLEERRYLYVFLQGTTAICKERSAAAAFLFPSGTSALPGDFPGGGTFAHERRVDQQSKQTGQKATLEPSLGSEHLHGALT